MSEAETYSRWVGWRELASEFGVGDDGPEVPRGCQVGAWLDLGTLPAEKSTNEKRFNECIRIIEEYRENRRPHSLEDINLEDLASACIRAAMWMRGMGQMGCVRKQRHSIQIWTQYLRARLHWVC